MTASCPLYRTGLLIRPTIRPTGGNTPASMGCGVIETPSHTTSTSGSLGSAARVAATVVAEFGDQKACPEQRFPPVPGQGLPYLHSVEKNHIGDPSQHWNTAMQHREMDIVVYNREPKTNLWNTETA